MAIQFQKFFNEEEIQTIIDRKADIELIDRLESTKAQKTDVQVTNSLIECLNGRLKHMSILVTELARANVPSKPSSSFKGGETINTKIQRNDFLSKQAQIVNSWISDTALIDGVNGLTSGASKNIGQNAEQGLFLGDIPVEVKEFERHFKNSKRSSPLSVKMRGKYNASASQYNSILSEEMGRKRIKSSFKGRTNASILSNPKYSVADPYDSLPDDELQPSLNVKTRNGPLTIGT